MHYSQTIRLKNDEIFDDTIIHNFIFILFRLYSIFFEIAGPKNRDKENIH
jgi:hypothetical protein